MIGIDIQETISSIRKLLESMIAPTVKDLSDDMVALKDQNKEIKSDIRDGFTRVEKRIDNIYSAMLNNHPTWPDDVDFTTVIDMVRSLQKDKGNPL